MPIDKSWIGKPQNTSEYAEGIQKFLEFAFENGSVDGHVIKCPCSRCGFNKWQNRGVVLEHLTLKPFPVNYKCWYLHGEESNSIMPQAIQITRATEETLQPHDPVKSMINSACGFTGNNINGPDVSCVPMNGEEIFNEEHIERPNEDYAKFYELIEDGKQPLYEGCTKYSKLSFLVKLYHIKCLCRMTEKAMSMILELLKDAFEDAKIPVSFYEAKKTINKLGLNYIKIHACPNDRMLFFGEDEGLQECKKCKTSRCKTSICGTQLSTSHAIIDEFKDHIRSRWKGRKPSSTDIEKIVNKDFIDWFPRKIMNTDISNVVSDDLKFLANGPAPHARRFTIFNINGIKFRTTSREHELKTQNSGVFFTSSTSCISSSSDGNSRLADLPYYGKLEDIIELNYYGRFTVTLFKCKWADTTRYRGFKKDTWGFHSVNFSQLIHIGDCEEHDPFIEASQAQMVCYVDDELDKGWSTVVHLKPRDLYDMGEEGENEVLENQFPVQDLDQFFGDVNELILCREDETDEFPVQD